MIRTQQRTVGNDKQAKNTDYTQKAVLGSALKLGV